MCSRRGTCASDPPDGFVLVENSFPSLESMTLSAGRGEATGSGTRRFAFPIWSAEYLVLFLYWTIVCVVVESKKVCVPKQRVGN